MSSESYRINSPSVVSETIDGEALIVNLENGNYYSATGTAEAIWGLVSSGVGVDAAVEALSCRFEGDAIASETSTFVESLVAANLLVKGDGDPLPAPSTEADAAKSAWSSPALQEYTDMQDLITLDPIHDVGDQGWPHAAPGAQTGQ